ncbi:DUF3349 domain-containing protein [Mycobacterium nebraskense]|uniref:Endonuclease n=1 Tax=Mycobacterium nebraskense TaxID=244292 RepID=A0A0F5N7Y1_9MYCO|nr:DUF3349 domain-containing protein [Mycobacterium nebraskense]KKC03131.1 hypothetical protein WU83_20540 [Mycobacterium nebraskense]KLO41188.1 hypothetical protein ABW17_14675 [Mycobacterium nebraskense]MBI2694120.1 DUF3349 domain-containing protein [Mycobacterium nebraskense]MCV7119140.1 DUF3349 domain-containing protein [Mycobacterium nebraskense]ORW15329.1 hypothetical protein AWC17_18050 [Mycobacterium nebraskense]
MNGFLNSIVSWLRAGYPEGVPPTDTFPVLALLARRMSNDDVKEVACELIHRGEFDDVDIGVLITQITDDLPTPEDVERVRVRLQARGWPFDDANEVEDPA